MRLGRRHTAAVIVGVAGLAGAFLLVPDAPEVVTVSPVPGEAAYTSVQEAVDSLGPRGGTVEVHEGTYAERLVLDGRRGVSVQARTGDRVVLDATGTEPPEGLSGVVEVRGGGLVELVGLELRGYRTERTGAVPVGLLVTGSVEGLTVEDLVVRELGTTAGAGSQAHGVAVVGDELREATTDLVLTGAYLSNLSLGEGAGILVDGNVMGWEVTRNRVHQVDHDGIRVSAPDAAPDASAEDPPVPRPRDGLLTGNSVVDVAGATNLAYGPEGCVCAAGLSIAGGLDLTLTDNTVSRADVGIEVRGDGTTGTTEGLDVLENVVEDARHAAMVIGADEAGEGAVTRVLARGNHLRGATTEVMVLLGHGLADTRFSSNDVVVAEPGPVLVQLAGTGPALDHNSYVAPSPVFRLGQREVGELRAWQLLTGEESVSSLRSP
ncbi:hypothetical protein [Ornithinimicrobium flavum]|uniref:hypothetical protein n=1 Tax=Ornithinimicrobium flavum TaxID=1288636 RepID=UPI00106FFC0C|nr:hypothetical protein [Ornithinimicrobium flavum]